MQKLPECRAHDTVSSRLPYMGREKGLRSMEQEWKKYADASNWHPSSRIFPLLPERELTELAEDITAHGLLQPITVYQGKVLDGRNRAIACARCNREPKVTEWTPNNQTPTEWVISQNLKRRHLTPSEKAVCAVEALPLLEAEAKERQRKHSDTAPGRKGTVRASVPEVSGGNRARTHAAKTFGVSERYVSDAKSLKEKAPEAFSLVREGKKKLPQAMKELKRKEQVQRIAVYAPPPGKFEVIVVDPPWQYDSRAEDSTHRAANPYPSMTLEEIKALEIPADEDCILWLWTTNAFMRQAYEVLDAWGFTPKTILTWCKSHFGLGDWLRGATEHCILAVKGKPVVTLTNQTTIIYGTLREHSRKPSEFFSMVESLCPAKTRREMFARQRRDGWVTDAPEADHFSGEA